jgi:hypothetical protein
MIARSLVLPLLVGSATACSTSPPAAPPIAATPVAMPQPGVDPFDHAAVDAHGIADTYCGKCHRGSSADAVSKALAIFDLDEKPWFGRMSEAQLEKAIGRMESKGTADERARFDAFIHTAIERLREADRCASRLRP